MNTQTTDELLQHPHTDPAVTQTLARIRHELRTPLNHILGYAELLMDQADEEGRTQWKADLGKIQSAGQRLLELMSVLFSENPETDVYTAPGTQSSGIAKTITWATMTGENPPLESVISLVSRQTLSEAIKTGAPSQFPLLVVDDEPNNREVLSRLLQNMGYVVEEAGSGEVALQMMARRNYDVVFLDVMMPVMDGYETLCAITGDEVLQYTPVIMVSALDELQVVAHCLEAGARDFLPKPFNTTILKARLTATLESKRLRDQEQELFLLLANAHEKLQTVESKRGGLVQDLMGDLRVALSAINRPEP